MSPRKKAKRWHEKGLNDREIGERLGVTGSCVWKWRHPEKAKAMWDASNHDSARIKQKNAWTRAARQNPEYIRPCTRCDGPTGYFKWDSLPNETPLCRACWTKQRVERGHQLEKWWGEGLSLAEIAERLGWTVGHLGVAMVSFRKQGYELPYRYVVENGKRVAA